ncbi:GNAT family N-acetyltransferase [Pseudoalteromonas mariniglutinosa]|uniref:GNAT family N-acetyltransferase n=1 Tax=Pseudoalteromonas mariniglutinosa TaxID=206042 RepID=UPI00384D91C2
MVTLRAFTQSDTDLLIDYLNNPSLVRFLSPKIPFPYTETDANWWINQGNKTGITRAIDVDGVFVGCIGALPGEFEYCKSAELGYWLAQDYWGQGIICIAISLLIDELKMTTDIVRLHAVVFAGNQQSSKVLTKTGFSYEGTRVKAIYKNAEFYDALLYGKLLG